MTLLEKAPKPFHSNFDPNAPEWLSAIRHALMSRMDQPAETSVALHGTQAQRTPTDSETEERYWEIKVPLTELKVEADSVRSVGLWNLILSCTRDGQEMQWSLTEKGKSEDPLYFPWIRMN